MQIHNLKVLVCLSVLLTATVMTVNAFTNSAYGQPYQMESGALGVQLPMQSTSPLLSTRGSYSVAMPYSEMGYFGCSATSRGQVSAFSFMTSRDSKSRRSWTRNNFFTADNLMSSGSAYASNVELNSGSAGGPRRVGGNDHDPDPFMGEPVPMGEMPVVLMALLAALYVLVLSLRHKKTVDAVK